MVRGRGTETLRCAAMPPRLRIAALEPYAARSHAQFLDGLARHSAHELVALTLPPRCWNWRMRTASLHYARVLEDSGPWDLLFASDYLNLAELQALLPERLPAIVYFHENQATYPLRDGQRRDVHHILTHLHSGLAAGAVLFNSEFHRRELERALAELASVVPDIDLTPDVRAFAARSSVLPLGTDLPAGEPRGAPGDGGPPIVLWNHRWEYDKDPDAMVDALVSLRERDTPFRLRLLGERFREVPPAFERLERELTGHLISAEFAPTRDAYIAAVCNCQVVLSTSRHEFFGLGTLEALRLGLWPVLPDDLAYPELLGDGDPEPFLYARDAGPVPHLERALAGVRAGAEIERRRALVQSTERFLWPALAPRFDAVFERVASGSTPPSIRPV